MAIDLARAGASLGVAVRRSARLAKVLLHLIKGFGLAIALGAFKAPHQPRVQLAARRWLWQLLGILGVELKTRGRPATAPALVVSNHGSWLDIAVLGAQSECCFLSKAEVRDWPLVGRLAEAAGTLFIRRGSGESGRKAAELAAHLRRGRTVLVFPEGTTVRRLHAPLFQAALDASVPVQPVTLRYLDERAGLDREVAFVGDDALHTQLWGLLGQRRLRVRLCYGPLITPAGDRERLAREARAHIASALEVPGVEKPRSTA